ncbi:MAG: hypothetical protein AAFX99_33150, partial [Myxococcota bacterium]
MQRCFTLSMTLIALLWCGCATQSIPTSKPPPTAPPPTTQSFINPTYTLVWADAHLYPNRASATAFRAYDFGQDGRSSRPGQLFTARVLQRDGAWYQIATHIEHEEHHCIAERLLVWDGVELKLWVHERDLAPTLNTRLDVAFDDGTQATLHPGTPIVAGRPWVDGFHLPITAKPSHTGLLYTPIDSKPQPQSTTQFRRITLISAQLGNKPVAWKAAPWYSNKASIE